MTVIRDPKTFCFSFDQPRDVNENLKHETQFITKINESENKINKKRD